MRLNLTAQSLPVYEALSSAVRLNIMNLLAERPMNIKELAEALGLSSAIMTMHVRKLEGAGLVSSEMAPGRNGLQKFARLPSKASKSSSPARRKTN